MTTIYLMRHSEVLKPINVKNSDSLQIQNEKWGLTINGEKIAKDKSKLEEMQNFDIVISSNYVRAILTAKYFTKDEILIDESFNERKFGVKDWEEMPQNFEIDQFKDFNYKIKEGESLNEVIQREYDSLLNILDNYKDKKVLIVGHSTAFSCLLSKWCEIDYLGSYKFNNKNFFDGKWNYCEIFKLEFDHNRKLISIQNIL